MQKLADLAAAVNTKMVAMQAAKAVAASKRAGATRASPMATSAPPAARPMLTMPILPRAPPSRTRPRSGRSVQPSDSRLRIQTVPSWRPRCSIGGTKGCSRGVVHAAWSKQPRRCKLPRQERFCQTWRHMLSSPLCSAPRARSTTNSARSRSRRWRLRSSIRSVPRQHAQNGWHTKRRSSLLSRLCTAAAPSTSSFRSSSAQGSRPTPGNSLSGTRTFGAWRSLLCRWSRRRSGGSRAGAISVPCRT